MSLLLGNQRLFGALDVEQVEAYFEPEQKIPLSTGSPRFPVPSSVKTAIQKEVDALPYLTYPPLEGEQQLRRAVASFHRARLSLPHDEDDILITYGAMQGLYDVLATEVGPGDEVLTPAPFWFQFPHIVTQTGAHFKGIDTVPEEQFKLTPKRLGESITASTKVLIFTNPNNPTGTIYRREELAALVEVLLKPENRHVQVISDEVYNLLLIDAGGVLPSAASIGSFPSIADRVITINSMSKNQAMSGLRVGYIASSGIERFRARQRFSTLGVNAYLQAGATTAVVNAIPIVGDIVKTLSVRRARSLELLRTIPRMRFESPESAYYFWVDVQGYYGCRTPGGETIRSDVELADYLDADAGVLVVKGTTCGTSGYFRITFAIEEALFSEGVRRMRRSLDKLRC